MTKVNKIIETGVAVDMVANEVSQNSRMNKQEKQIFNETKKENLYEIDKKKRKKLFNIYADDYKKTMSKEHKWVFFFYIVSILMIFIVLISTIACVVLLKDTFDKAVIGSIVLIFGLLFDILPYSAYKFSVNMTAFGDFYYRKKEKIVVNEQGFDYFFYDKRVNYLNGVAMFKYSIDYKNIDYVLYDERVGELIIVGVKCYQYLKDNTWKELNYTGVEMQDSYSVNIIELLKKNNVEIRKMNYLVQREETKKAIEKQLAEKM